MSPINSALQYKIQKMEKYLSSLTEENEALKAIITEANVAGMSPAAAFNYGGGAALGRNLGMYPQVRVGGMGKVGGMSPTSTSTGGGLMSGGVGSFGGNVPAAARSVAAQPTQGLVGQYTGGQGIGELLASLEGNPQAQQIVQQYFGLPLSAATSTGVSTTQTTQRRR